MEARREEAYAALNRAIELLAEDAIAQGHVPVDAVLAVGMQRLDPGGQRIGGVAIYLKDGFGPLYAAKGLLVDALDSLRQPCSCGR